MTPGSPVEAYSLMFRTGVVECVAPILSNDPTRASVSAYRIEEVVLKAWEGFVAFAKAYGIEPPALVFATLLEIGNIRITTTSVDEVPSSVCAVPIARLPEVFGLRQAAGGAVQKDARRRRERVRPSEVSEL